MPEVSSKNIDQTDHSESIAQYRVKRPIMGVIWRSMTFIHVFLAYRLYEFLPQSGLSKACHWLAYCLPTRWSHNLRSASLASRTQQAFQSLGPVAIKFGQMLSTRHDLLTPETASALSHLQDQMPHFTSDQARSIITQSFGLPITDIFSRFDETPLAAASIAQIHTAELKPSASLTASPEEVIIKIIRPGIVPAILKETQVLLALAKMIMRLVPEARRFHLETLVEDYQRIILDECDLRKEAKNTQQFARNFEQSDLLYVPKIHSPWVSMNVFVMERVYGIPVNDVGQLQKLGVDLQQLSTIGATIFLTQVFRDNFFHADMHPGNILVDATDPQNPRYIALDCAIAGHLKPRDHRLLTRQLLALFKQDYLRLARLLINGGWVPADTHRQEFAIALEQVCSPIMSKPLSEIDFGPLLASLFRTARAFDLQALPQFVLLEKTLLHVEGLGRQLDPDLDIWTLGQPLLTRWLRASALEPNKIKGVQRRVNHIIETLPEALEDWYDQQIGLRATTAEANGVRLKTLELALEANTKRQRATQLGLLYTMLGFVFWGLNQWSFPLIAAIPLALSIYYLALPVSKKLT